MDVVKLWGSLLANCPIGTNIYSVPTVYLKTDENTDDVQAACGVVNETTNCEESYVFPANDAEFSSSEDESTDCKSDEEDQDEPEEGMQHDDEDDEVDNAETNEMEEGKDDVEPARETCENSDGGAMKKQAKILRNRYSREEYKCTMCPYTCTTEKAFVRHLQRCESAEERAEIQLHLSCPVCGKDRKGESSLTVHMKKHKDDKKFCCDICKFRTLQLKKLIQHRRMHTGERPHLCPFCKYRSARRDNLRSHARRVHKQDNLPCDTFTPRNILLTPRKIN